MIPLIVWNGGNPLNYKGKTVGVKILFHIMGDGFGFSPGEIVKLPYKDAMRLILGREATRIRSD